MRVRGARPSAALTPADLAAIEQPVPLIWGSDDPFGSAEIGRAGARHFRDAEFHEVGIGHLLWADEPEACGDLVRTFLGRTGEDAAGTDTDRVVESDTASDAKLPL